MNARTFNPTPRAPAGGHDGAFAFKMKLGNVCGVGNDVHKTRSFLSEPDIERTVDLEQISETGEHSRRNVSLGRIFPPILLAVHINEKRCRDGTDGCFARVPVRQRSLRRQLFQAIRQGVRPDFEYSGCSPNTQTLFIKFLYFFSSLFMAVPLASGIV